MRRGQVCPPTAAPGITGGLMTALCTLVNSSAELLDALNIGMISPMESTITSVGFQTFMSSTICFT